jgi:hypothetical protein
MSRDLKQKMTIAPLVKQTPGRRSFHGQTAKHEGPRRESEILCFVIPFLADHTDCLGLSKLPARDDEFRVFLTEYFASGLEADVIGVL